MKISRFVSRSLCLLGLWLGLGLQAHAQTDKVTYVYTDPQGTPLVEADASGNIVARYDYTPYGNSVASLGAAPNGPGYTGHVNDPETGLVYMQARYYQPTGRFLSPDPVGPSAGSVYSFNRYAYASNNPVGRIDPDGRADEPADEAREEMDELFPKLSPNLDEYGPNQRMPGESDLIFAFRQEYASAEACSAPGVKVDYAKVEQTAEQDVSYENLPDGHGVIYLVSGENTLSGLDYVGSTDDMSRREKDMSDGRNRRGAKILDIYDKSDKEDRRKREQNAINGRGGVGSTDNKRNEVAQKYWIRYRIDPVTRDVKEEYPFEL